MKRPLNTKPDIPAAIQKAKKTLVSAKEIAPVEKHTAVSATKTKPEKVKNSVVKSKNQTIKTSAPTRKSKTAVSKKKQIPAANLLSAEIKIAEPKISKIKTIKSQPLVTAKKNLAAKSQKTAGRSKTEKFTKNVLTEKVTAAKPQPRVPTQQKISKNEVNKQIGKSQKTERLPTDTTIRKINAIKSQTLIEQEKSVKSQSKISTRKVLPKTSEKKATINKAKSKVASGKKSAKKDIAGNSSKTPKATVKIENKQLSSKISKIAKVENQKIVEVHLVKKLKLPAGLTAPKKKRIGKQKKVKPVEIIAEPPILATPEPKPKKAKAISSAVFRGAKSSYDFTVFPLDAVFENVPAIYIISRRVVDKSKKAHHALVCIGQTESLLDELKKHKKDKRAKKFAANSISLLREENEHRRLKIETDLKAAHAIRCLYA